MPQDPFSSDDLKLRFIFVPHGETPSEQVMDGDTDWVKVPGHFEPRDGDNRAAGPSAQVSPDGRTGANTPDARSAPNSLAMPASLRHMDGGGERTVAGLADDPIAAYRRANSALDTAQTTSQTTPPTTPPTAGANQPAATPDANGTTPRATADSGRAQTPSPTTTPTAHTYVAPDPR